MTEATKTKTTKIQTIRPPAELQSKPYSSDESDRSFSARRRAWLEAKAAEINAQPNRSAKIVGVGSYQSVSVYEIKEVAGRERFRGICQICGGSQVVDNGRIVLHGYKRPGWGYTVGNCHGTKEAPLNVDKTLTVAALAHWTERLKLAKAAAEAAKLEENAAAIAWRASGYVQPSTPRPQVTREIEREGGEKLKAHRAALKAWKAANPVNARYDAAQANVQHTRNEVWGAGNMVKHFETLLASGVHGSPLEREVVA